MYKSFFIINYLSFSINKLYFVKNFTFMSSNLIEIDSAMNMIKEDVIRELSEAVSKQNNDSYSKDLSSSTISSSENLMG